MHGASDSALKNKVEQLGRGLAQVKAEVKAEYMGDEDTISSLAGLPEPPVPAVAAGPAAADGSDSKYLLSSKGRASAEPWTNLTSSPCLARAIWSMPPSFGSNPVHSPTRCFITVR
jgi:hypothetical protein